MPLIAQFSSIDVHLSLRVHPSSLELAERGVHVQLLDELRRMAVPPGVMPQEPNQGALCGPNSSRRNHQADHLFCVSVLAFARAEAGTGRGAR